MLDVDIPLDQLSRFGLAAAIGMLIGLERGMKTNRQPHAGPRDFVLFAIAGALAAMAAQEFQSVWILIAMLTGIAAFLLSGYWADVRAGESGERGITTEIAGLLTFMLGAAAIAWSPELTIAFTVVVLVVLSQKLLIGKVQQNVQRFELEAAVKLLVITFIVLPFLPRVALDHYLTVPAGIVTSTNTVNREIRLAPTDGSILLPGAETRVFADREEIGVLRILEETEEGSLGQFVSDVDQAALAGLNVGAELRVQPRLPALLVMAGAISPFRLWLIVILVSSISFVGYVLVKVMGSAAGIGLTGLVGGLASSTATALSFARRSIEMPSLNNHFAVAVILASTVMFPRLMLQIAIVNPQLAARVAVPLLVMTAAGGVLAAFFYWKNRRGVAAGTLKLDNPFSLSAAVKFAAVFATVLVGTQLAIAYLGDAWLPLVAVVSGLTDADAIAFSLSAAQRTGQISTDWAAFNLVLGAISNTFTKLLLIFTLGDRGLFRQVAVAFLLLAGVGLVTAFAYFGVVPLV